MALRPDEKVDCAVTDKIRNDEAYRNASGWQLDPSACTPNTTIDTHCQDSGAIFVDPIGGARGCFEEFDSTFEGQLVRSCLWIECK